jgi:regulator of replication initiation timing
MGFFKDAGDSLSRYSEIIVNRTEEYTKIAKLTLDIRRINSDIQKLKIHLAETLFPYLEKDDPIDPTRGEFRHIVDEIRQLDRRIEELEAEIQDLKNHEENSSAMEEEENPEGEKG